jgi:FkbM family methyltransferase
MVPQPPNAVSDINQERELPAIRVSITFPAGCSTGTLSSMLGRLAERTGRRVYRVRDLPWGMDFRRDSDRRAPQVSFETIFDVGANVGQSSLRFASWFPRATVWAFEPFAEAFEQLQQATRALETRCFKLALGSRPETLTVALSPLSVNNSLRNVTVDPCGETVEVTTLDAFAATHEIPHIDLLKIDTEGWDLDVLQGADRLLLSSQIAFVQVEAGMNPHNPKHVPLARLEEHLEARGYTIFGLYGQTPEWTGEARLRFVDAVFCSATIAAESISFPKSNGKPA